MKRGDMVLARSVKDGYWYRALVTHLKDDIFSFWCPDFGFSETVPRCHVREINQRISSTFTQTQFLACRCVLYDWRPGTPAPSKDEVRTVMKKLPVSASAVDIYVTSVDEDKTYVIDVQFLCRD